MVSIPFLGALCKADTAAHHLARASKKGIFICRKAGKQDEMKNKYMVEVDDGQIYRVFWEGFSAKSILKEVKETFDEKDMKKVKSIKVYRIEKEPAAGYTAA